MSKWLPVAVRAWLLLGCGLQDPGGGYAGEPWRALGCGPHLVSQELLECLGLSGAVEVELDDDVPVVTGGLVQPPSARWWANRSKAAFQVSKPVMACSMCKVVMVAPRSVGLGRLDARTAADSSTIPTSWGVCRDLPSGVVSLAWWVAQRSLRHAGGSSISQWQGEMIAVCARPLSTSSVGSSRSRLTLGC